MVRLLFALLFFFVTLGSAYAQSEPLLKSSVEVNSDLVTLGDLFDHAGQHAETAVFRAPAPGTRGQVTASAIAEAAETAGMNTFDLAGLRSVDVVRSGLRLDDALVRELIDDALQSHLETLHGFGRFDFTLANSRVQQQMIGARGVDELSANLVVPPGRRNSGFLAVIRGPNGAEITRIEGRASHQVEVPVLARPIARGATINQGDVRLSAVPYARVAGIPTVLHEADLIGQAATRSLRAGVPINRDDIDAPALVSRQDLVTLIYRQGALALSVRARALDDGAEGQAVDVTNLQSGRVVRGIVTGRGIVQVVGALDQIAAVAPEQSQ
ncbi:MAG: flagellar basal body P-ring formation chaperone FlgA [Pseudomonadota bacterium]